MVGGRPSSTSADGTVGLWKHQSIYKGKRPAHAQLPLLHQLLGYIGKRNVPRDGTFWKLPFGKRLQDGVEFDDGENDNYDIDVNEMLEKRGYDEVPLLHYSFGKRSYEPLLHSMLGKRSWNDFPFILPKTRKNDNYMPLLHQFGFGKRSQTPLLHSMLGKRDSSENELAMSKRQDELLEHTIDENEDYYLVKRSTNVGGPPPYYDEGIEGVESRSVSGADARRWRDFVHRYPDPKGRKKRSVPQEEKPKEEEKRGWGSGKMNLDELKSGVWFGKRDDVKEDKKASPVLHQIGSTAQQSVENAIDERNKKSYKFSTQLDKWGKRFGDDIVWGKMYRAFKRAIPILHHIGTFGKRFSDDIMWDTYTNGMKRSALLLHQMLGKRFSDDITWDTYMKDMKRNAPLLHQMAGKRFGDDITWDTLMNEFKRNQIPLLHQNMGKRFDDDIMWDTFTNGMKRNSPLLHQMLGKRFGDDITWDTFMNERKRNQAPLLHEMLGKRFGDDITWDQLMNEMKRNDFPMLHQLRDKRFDDDIKWDTFLNEFKRSQTENLGKRLDDNIVWGTYLNGVKRSDVHEDDKKASPLLHQLGSFGKKSAPTLHPGDDGDDDDKRASPLLHQIGGFGKKSESHSEGDE